MQDFVQMIPISVSNLMSVTPKPPCFGNFCQPSHGQIPFNKPLKMQHALRGATNLGEFNFCDDPDNLNDPACQPL